MSTLYLDRGECERDVKLFGAKHVHRKGTSFIVDWHRNVESVNHITDEVITLSVLPARAAPNTALSARALPIPHNRRRYVDMSCPTWPRRSHGEHDSILTETNKNINSKKNNRVGRQFVGNAGTLSKVPSRCACTTSLCTHQIRLRFPSNISYRPTRRARTCTARCRSSPGSRCSTCANVHSRSLCRCGRGYRTPSGGHP